MTSSLTTVWRKFLDMVSSSGTDFLSLQHLGIILACLADRGQLFYFILFYFILFYFILFYFIFTEVGYYLSATL
jgi:hypothetical protein